MSLLFEPRKLCRIEYNIQRGKALKDEDFVFGKPIDLRDFVGQRKDGKNTMLPVTVAGEKVNFFYNRIDPTANFFEQFNPQSVAANNVWRLILEKDSVGSTKKLARPIARCFGIPITEDDIASEPFTPPAVADQTVTITFGKDGLLFLPGTKVTLAIEGIYRVVDGKAYYVTDFNRNPDCFYEDHVARSRTAATFLRAAQLTFGNDYTPAGRWLKRLKGNTTYVANESIGGTTDAEPFASLLAQALGQCDGFPWVSTKGANAPFNIWGGWIMYNGPVAGCEKAALSGPNVPAHLVRLMKAGNAKYDNVVVIGLPTLANTTTMHCALFHYNNPKE